MSTPFQTEAYGDSCKLQAIFPTENLHNLLDMDSSSTTLVGTSNTLQEGPLCPSSLIRLILTIDHEL